MYINILFVACAACDETAVNPAALPDLEAPRVERLTLIDLSMDVDMSRTSNLDMGRAADLARADDLRRPLVRDDMANPRDLAPAADLLTELRDLAPTGDLAMCVVSVLWGPPCGPLGNRQGFRVCTTCGQSVTCTDCQ